MPNGFAFDDEWFIAQNPVVTEARFGQAFADAAWPGAIEGVGNYRPITLVSFGVEWALWGETPAAFHAVSVLAHAAVSVLVLTLLATWVGLPGAFVGGLFFAAHPVHTEAVANVMGRAELYAAMAFLAAVLLHLRPRGQGAPERGGRLLALVTLYLLAVGSKEIAVTLPGLLVVMELFRRSERPLRARLLDDAPVYLALFATMGIYVLVRWQALGGVTGSSPAPGLLTLEPGERVLTALTIWPHYLRLLIFPMDLVADYGPDVITMTRSVTAEVVLGVALLTAAVAGASLLRVRAPAVGFGLAWFVVTISPVSNLLVRSDILLAERTLYLPSVGAAFVVAAAAAAVVSTEWAGVRRVAAPIGAAVLLLLTARTVERNPAWADTYTALNVLAMEHPESWLAHRAHAIGLEAVGERASAAEQYEAAIEIAPDHYQLLVEAAQLYHEMGRHERAEELLASAIELSPRHTEAYRRLAEHRLLRGDGRAAHAAALSGIERATGHAVLWALLSESYVAKGDLEAAVRARGAAVARDSLSAAHWSRLAELLDAMERAEEAERARQTATTLRRRGAEGGDA